MNTFRFRLDRILRWRTVELSKEERRVKELMEKDSRLANKLESLREEKAEVEDGIRNMAGLGGGDLNALAGYAIHALVQRQGLQNQRSENEKALRLQVQRYRTAKQRHRALEELRKRRLGEWRLEAARELEEVAEDSYRARSHDNGFPTQLEP